MHQIVYYSVAGATAKTAGWIKERLEEEGRETRSHNLAFDGPLKADPAGGAMECLWILSPVYVSHPAPAVTDFLKGLPSRPGLPAVPLVTYGVVCSGTALAEMGDALVNKGFTLAGGAKVVAQHSMMWPYAEPLGKGRPDEGDREKILGLVDRVLAGISSPGGVSALNPALLDYQPGAIRQAAAAKSLADLKTILPPMGLNEAKCNECGLCLASCPNRNITLNPLPVFGGNCMFCLNCMKTCPQEAIETPIVGGLEAQLRERAQVFGEPVETRIF